MSWEFGRRRSEVRETKPAELPPQETKESSKFRSEGMAEISRSIEELSKRSDRFFEKEYETRAKEKELRQEINDLTEVRKKLMMKMEGIDRETREYRELYNTVQGISNQIQQKQDEINKTETTEKANIGEYKLKSAEAMRRLRALEPPEPKLEELRNARDSILSTLERSGEETKEHQDALAELKKVEKEMEWAESKALRALKKSSIKGTHVFFKE